MPSPAILSGMAIGISRSAAGRNLFLASFLSLFLELALIRWIPGTIHAVAFFNNLVLISCFLGLGIGMAQQSSLERAAKSALWRLTAIILFFGLLALLQPTVRFGVQSDYAVNEGSSVSFIKLPIALVILGVFLLTAWAAVPYGQLVAVFFDQMKRLRAYSINIAGSLLGVLLFALCSWFSVPPSVWFAVCILCLFVLDSNIRDFRPLMIIVGVLFTLYGVDSERFTAIVRWSPYYKVRSFISCFQMTVI